MNSFVRLIREHFSRLTAKNKWPYLWRAWLEAVLLAYIVGIMAQLIFPAGPRSDVADMSVYGLLGLVLVVGPLWETLIFQCVSLEVAEALGFRRLSRLFFSVVPFALLHRFAGVPTVMAAGMVGGFYFALAYERWRKESLIVGIGMTFLLHSSFNLVGVVGMLVMGR
jgi:hypothetical protein